MKKATTEPKLSSRKFEISCSACGTVKYESTELWPTTCPQCANGLIRVLSCTTTELMTADDAKAAKAMLELEDLPR